MAIPYTLTNESITVINEGKSFVVQAGAANFNVLRAALLAANWDEVVKHLTVASALKNWVRDGFTLEGQTLKFQGSPLPFDLTKRVTDMVSRGEDPVSFLKFWERLQKNPSWRSVNQLWGFLVNTGIPLTEEGCFLAYKSVRHNFLDHHSGTILNKPGELVKMKRNLISDDPVNTCHVGLHVGALSYAKEIMSDGRIVICKVDPENVVCVPNDHNARKMRVCEYEVVGMHGGELPNTVFTDTSHEEVELEDGSSEEPEQDKGEDEDDAKVADDMAVVDDGESDEGADHSADADYAHLPMARAAADKSEPINSSLPGEVGEDPAIDAVHKEHPEKRKPKRGFAKFDKKDQLGLMECSIMDLRRYATYGLRIVGASKIAGGKTALVYAILQVRA